MSQENDKTTQLTPEQLAALKRLDALVGDWQSEMLFPFDPPITVYGRTRYEWLEAGGFLIERSTVKDMPEAPNAICVIGVNEDAETFALHSFDSRGISRIYQMSLNGNVWKIWRDEPGFLQRFTGTFSDDGKTIRGTYEKSVDDKPWEHDFDIIFTRTDSTT